MPHMKSIRISDEVYEAALDESGLSNRSIAKQIEYWVRLGMNADKAGFTQGCCYPQASLELDLKTIVPDNARGFRVYVNPHAKTYVQQSSCLVAQTALSESPPTAISILLSTIRERMQYCGPTPPNTTWDDGLSFDVTIGIINRDGQVGPLSAVLVAKDNTKPEITTASTYYPEWRPGMDASSITVDLRISESVSVTLLRDKTNYAVISTDADTYAVNSVEVADGDTSRVIVHISFESKAGTIANIAATDGNNTPATATLIPSHPARLTGSSCCGSNPIDYYSFDGQQNMVLDMRNDTCCVAAEFALYFGEISPGNLVTSFTQKEQNEQRRRCARRSVAGASSEIN